MQGIDSGKIVSNMIPVDLDQIFEQSRFIFNQKLQSKNLTLNFPDVRGIKILTDEIIFSNNVFNNILSNAIKFSPEGSKIDILVEEKDENIIISIRDYGIGMPQNILAKVFDPSVHTTRKGTNNESGTGFGLPIVKKYMDSFDGDIEITSTTVEENPYSKSGTTCTLKLKKAA